VKWDIFSRGRKGKRGEAQEKIEDLVRRIERFAPREYRAQRQLYYYNYKIMAPYLNPLLALLETLSQVKRLNADKTSFLDELFERLKGFYDRKGRLSPAEAMEDRNLKIKFRDMLLFFYGKKEAPRTDPGRTSGIDR
jgi:hypothetical protein